MILSTVARCLVYPVGELFITGAPIETFNFLFFLLVSLNKIRTIPKSITIQLRVMPVIAPIDKLWISSRCTCMHAKSVPDLLTLWHTILKVDLTPFSRNVPTHNCLYGKRANGQIIHGHVCTCDVGINGGIRANTTV